MSNIEDEIVAPHFISADAERWRRFYTAVQGGKTAIGGEAGYGRDPDGYIIEVAQTALDRGRRPPSA